MSLDLFADSIRASDQEVTANIAANLPAGFGESFDVAVRYGLEWKTALAQQIAKENALNDYIQDVRDKTGETLPNPGYLIGGASLDDFNAAQAKIVEKYPNVNYLTPLSPSDIDAMTQRRMAKAHNDAAAFQSRETTWGGTAGSFLGSQASVAADPVMLATLPLGGAGEAGIGLRALEFAGISGGTEAANAGINYRSHEAAVPGSSKEIPGDVLGATASGAVLGGAFGFLSKLLGAGAKVLPTSVRDEVNAAASEAQLNATNPFPSATGETAARDATVEATTSVAKGETVTAGNDFDARHVADYALAAKATTPEELALAGEQHLRPETFGEQPDVERFDRMPSQDDDVASYWDRRVSEASPDERAELGATDADESIRSAAVRHEGEIYEGALHSDAYEAAAQATGKEFGDVIAKAKPQDAGFMTSKGRFVDREEAAEIANAAQQTDRQAPLGYVGWDNSLSAENLPEGYSRAADAIAPRDMTPEQVAHLAADPATDAAVLHNLDHIRAENPDAQFGVQIRQPDGSYQVVNRKLSDVLDEIDGMETAGKELEACAVGMAMAAE